MGKVRYTTGKYAATPYQLPQTEIPVFCVEELCYVLAENAFLLDKSVCNAELAQWLETQCELPDLASQLRQLFRQDGSVSAMVGIILDYVGYATPGIRSEIEQLYRQSTDMDSSVKKKRHADYLLSNDRVSQAIREYGQLLHQLPEQNHALRCEVLINFGTALCRLFHFQEASEQFRAAYLENPMNPEAGIHYLSSQRMLLSDEDYIAFIANHPEWHELSLQLEEHYAEGLRDYPASADAGELRELEAKKNTPETVRYYQELSKRLFAMKQKYREMTTD